MIGEKQVYLYDIVLLKCAVKAATHGRVLVLEGIEKAERNVLPVLNNLLENREMQLEDGRFLMAAERYDKLLMVSLFFSTNPSQLTQDVDPMLSQHSSAGSQR